MHKARIVAITGAALLAVTASALAAWWMTGRSRRQAEVASSGGTAVPGEVVIEIPRAAGPTSVAQIDAIAPLDPGRIADGGASPEAAQPAPPKHAATPHPKMTTPPSHP